MSPSEGRSGSWAWIRETLSTPEDNAKSFERGSWANAQATLPERGVLWAQYEKMLDLYKYYLDIAWKASVWYYGITGAVLTYYLGHVQDQLPGPLPLALGFLSFVSLGFSVLYYRAAQNFRLLRDLLERIALALQLPGRPHVEFATAFVLMTSLLMGVAAVAFAGLLLFNVDRIAMR